MELTNEMKSVAMQAKSVEELLELAKEYDYSISMEEAEEVFSELSKEGELSDEELENVAGGRCYSKDPHGYLIVTVGNSCKGFRQSPFRKDKSGCMGCHYLYKRKGSLTHYCSARTRYNDPYK